MKKILAVALVLSLAAPSHALTVGGLWAAFDGSNHALVSGSHLQKLGPTQVELSAKWQGSEKAGRAWDYGVDQVSRLWILRVEDEWRQRQTHYAYGGGAGLGFGALSATYGLRVEEPDLGGRQTFLRGRVGLRFNVGFVGIVAVAERLDAPGEHRTDFRIQGKAKAGKAFVGGFVEDVRDVPVRGLLVGYDF